MKDYKEYLSVLKVPAKFLVLFKKRLKIRTVSLPNSDIVITMVLSRNLRSSSAVTMMTAIIKITTTTVAIIIHTISLLAIRRRTTINQIIHRNLIRIRIVIKVVIPRPTNRVVAIMLTLVKTRTSNITITMELTTTRTSKIATALILVVCTPSLPTTTTTKMISTITTINRTHTPWDPANSNIMLLLKTNSIKRISSNTIVKDTIITTELIYPEMHKIFFFYPKPLHM